MDRQITIEYGSRIWEIYRKIDNAVKCEKQLRQQTARPKSYPQLQFSQYNTPQFSYRVEEAYLQPQSSQYNYSVPAQQERFTFLLDQEQSLSDEELADQIKLASEKENKLLHGGIHPIDAFVKQEKLKNLIIQPYLDGDIYGNIGINPLDAFKIKNIHNTPIKTYQYERCLF